MSWPSCETSASCSSRVGLTRNAAWQRPDAFSRVYANSGSFVAFRGGHEFPTLVRKTEPNAEALWLMVRVERSLGNRQAEARYSAQLRRKFPLSPEAEELLKGNFE